MGWLDEIGNIAEAAMDIGAVLAAPETGGMSLAASPSASGFLSDAMGGFLGDLGSAAIGGGLSFLGQSSANQSNIAAAREQMAFQERMANTQYQRAVKDLQAAGLNPMMAYGNIHTSSPSGALGIGSQNTLGGIGTALSSVKPSEITKRGAEVQNLKTQNELLGATTAKEVATAENLRQQTKTGASQEVLNAASTAAQVAAAKASSAQAARQAAETRLLTLQVPKAQNEAAAESSWWKKNVSPYLPDVKMGTQAVTNTAGAIRKIPNYTIIGNPQ